jgi:hypothetical protein
MPYIRKGRRDAFYCTGDCEREEPVNVGELTFVLTKEIRGYLYADSHVSEGEGDHILCGCVNYARLAEILAALESAKLEFYRRVVAPYEDKKCAENGDVYAND